MYIDYDIKFSKWFCVIFPKHHTQSVQRGTDFFLKTCYSNVSINTMKFSGPDLTQWSFSQYAPNASQNMTMQINFVFIIVPNLEIVF